MTHLRLTHPDLDFWIDVRLREFDGRWLAVAHLADEPVLGMGESTAGAPAGALGVPRAEGVRPQDYPLAWVSALSNPKPTNGSSLRPRRHARAR